MLLRMERHFKSEQEARKQAEEMVEQSVQGELSAKKKLEETIRQHTEEKKETEEERNAIKLVIGSESPIDVNSFLEQESPETLR